jgi:hypothetical protein
MLIADKSSIKMRLTLPYQKGINENKCNKFYFIQVDALVCLGSRSEIF